MSVGNIFSVGDKAIFDALNQGAITKAVVRDFFLRRGIVISENTDRKQLAHHFSSLLPDYHDFQALADILQPLDRRDKFTSKRVLTALRQDDVEAAAHDLKVKIEEEGFSAEVKVFNTNIVSIQIQYKAQNFNRNEFRQTVSRTAEISVETDESGATLRYEQNREVDEWATAMLAILEKKSGGELEVEEIDLSHIESPELRTKFFVELIENVKGYPSVDVTDAYAFNPKKQDEQTRVADNGVHISKASLKGEGVLRSTELQKLLQSGFFISKMIWTARSTEGSSDIYEFEAMFADPQSCTGFSYLPRGFYRFENGEYATTRSALPRSSDRTLSKLLEAAAHHVVSKLLA